MTVKIAGQFTKDTRDRNGLTPISGQIIAGEEDWTGYAVVRLEWARTSKERRDGGVPHPTVAVVHIEPVNGDDTDPIRELLTRLYETRTGRTPLPLDMAADADAETADVHRVAAERTDPFYGGPLKGDVDLLDDGPVAERKPDEWLDNS